MSRANFLNSIPTQAPREGLAWEWLLDWNWDDTSWNWNNGTPTNITWVSADRGYVEEVGSFNGSSSYIDVSTNLVPSWTDFTVNAWVSLDSFTESVNHILCGNTGSWYPYQFSIRNDASFNFTLWDGSYETCRSAASLVNLSEWQMLTYVGEPSQKWKLYLNWLQLDNTSFITDDTMPSSWNTPTNINIWRDGRDNDRRIDGEIWLLRIYDKILNQSEIYSLYLEGLR